MVQGLIVREAGGQPELLDFELPDLLDTDVRVDIASAGVCHSDLSMLNGSITPQFPLILGHEASGTISEIGSAVADVAVGDRVVLNWAAACRHCWFCLQGEFWLCTEVEGVTSVPRGHLADGTQLNAAMGVGGFAEQAVLPARSVVPLPDGVPLDLAALLGCSVLTGIGAVRNTSKVRSGESVLVIGLGGIGLSTILGAHLAGAGPIIAVDLAPEKEELARAAGATHFVVSDPKISRQIRALTGGRGADHTFECVGHPATIRMAWGSTRRGGKCTIVGIGRKEQEVVFNPLELFHFSRTLTSSIYGESDPNRDIPVLAGQIESGALDIGVLVTDRIGPKEIDEAFDRMKAGQGGRSLIDWSSKS